MATAVVLGCGMVGATIARDLAADSTFTVRALDAGPTALAALEGVPRLATARADLSNAQAIRDAVRDADVVVGALPSALGLRTLDAVIDAKKPYVDISFLAEDGAALDRSERARAAGVTAILDCGVCPGLSNILIGASLRRFARCDRIDIMVGGLPVARTLPWQYKAPFAPSDVIEEYTRPARLVERGAVVVKPALSEPELVEFADVGTLEAFNTDGLRSLVRTCAHVPHMRERTLRYPGHIDLARALRDMGLFSQEPVELSGGAVRPIELTSRLLFPTWEFRPREPDLTVMRVALDGVLADGREGGVTWEMLDRYDAATDTRSMSRTTGFPAAIVARLLATGRLERPGVHAPEALGDIEWLAPHVLDELGRRGVVVTETRR